MFDVGGGELILIFIVVLLLFGPKKIPEVMRSFGKGLRQFRQAQEDLKTQLRDISSDIERSTEIRTVQPTITYTPPPEEVKDASGITQSEPEDSTAGSDNELASVQEFTPETGAIHPDDIAKPVPRLRPTVTDASAADLENMEDTNHKPL